jgi:hypothetical protein
MRFVALVVGRDAALAHAMQRLGIEHRVVDAAGELVRLYGARSGDLWLIRPDGYIGLCAPARARAPIVAYLSQLWPAAEVDRLFADSLAGTRAGHAAPA